MSVQSRLLPAIHHRPECYSASKLWKSLRKVARHAGRRVLHAALVLFYCMRDKDTPAWAKGVIVGALGYLILPTDLIPDMIPGIGYGDDWSAIVAALASVAAYIKDEHKAKATQQTERFFGELDPQAPPGFGP